jgi:hypothetical protein
MLRIDQLRKQLTGFESFCVIIGGTACAILFEEINLEFRSTKDIDLVLIVEAMDQSAFVRIWRFLEDGGYLERKMTPGQVKRYRFSTPTQQDYPKIVELFTTIQIPHHDNLPIGIIQAPDDLFNLSAILLNQEVYEYIRDQSAIHDGIRIAEAPELIVLKAVAYCDNKKRKALGENVKEEDIKKHVKDIVRLSEIVDPNQRVILPNGILSDSITEIINYLRTIQTINIDGRDIANCDIIRVITTLFRLSSD